MRKESLVLVLAISALLVAGATAYVVTTLSAQTTVQEAISVSEQTPLAASMYPGQSNTWVFTVSNAAPDVSYTITLIPQITTDAGVIATIESVVVDGTAIQPDANGNYVFTINPASTATVEITIKTTTDSAPGTVSVSVAVDRS